MNNEEYLREIIREAVEDVLYEFKSDIEYETKARLLKDRESGNHDPRRRESIKTDPYPTRLRPTTMNDKKWHDLGNYVRTKQIDAEMEDRDRTGARRSKLYKLKYGK